MMYLLVSNDTNNNSSPLMNKIFDARYRVLLLLCTVICVFTVTLYSQYLPYDWLTTSSCTK